MSTLAHGDIGMTFCYVTGLVEDEWGYSSDREFVELTLPGTKVPLIEIDRDFEPTLFSKLKL